MDLNSVKGILEAYSSNEITLDLATALINAIKEKETKCESKEESSIEKKIEEFIKNDIISCLYHEDYDEELEEKDVILPELEEGQTSPHLDKVRSFNDKELADWLFNFFDSYAFTTEDEIVTWLNTEVEYGTGR